MSLSTEALLLLTQIQQVMWITAQKLCPSASNWASMQMWMSMLCRKQTTKNFHSCLLNCCTSTQNKLQQSIDTYLVVFEVEDRDNSKYHIKKDTTGWSADNRKKDLTKCYIPHIPVLDERLSRLKSANADISSCHPSTPMRLQDKDNSRSPVNPE